MPLKSMAGREGGAHETAVPQIGSERGAKPPTKSSFRLCQVWGRRLKALGGGGGRRGRVPELLEGTWGGEEGAEGAAGMGRGRGRGRGRGESAEVVACQGHTQGAVTGSPVPSSPSSPHGGCLHSPDPPGPCGDSSPGPSAPNLLGAMMAPRPSIIPAAGGGPGMLSSGVG